MKRLFIFWLGLIMLFAFAACDSRKSGDNPIPPQQEKIVNDSGDTVVVNVPAEEPSPVVDEPAPTPEPEKPGKGKGHNK